MGLVRGDFAILLIQVKPVSSLGYEPKLNYLSVATYKTLLDASLVCNLSNSQ